MFQKRKKYFLGNKYLLLLVFSAEILIILAVLIMYLSEKSKGMDGLDTGIRVEDFSSDYISYNDGWYIDPGIVDIGDQESIDFLYGPFITLPKGNYTLVVEYECDEDQQVRPYASGADNQCIIANHLNLDKNAYAVSYSFFATTSIDDFETRVFYNGQGIFKINDIKVYRNLNGYKKALFILLCIFFVGDMCLVNKEKIFSHKKEFIILASTIILISLPLFMDGMIYPEGDTGFHLMRIEGLSDELRQGHVPVRIQSAWGSGNGYPVSIYYGDILLYFPALLRLIGFSISTSYALYVAFINIITVLISYYSFKIIVKDRKVALLMVLAYTASIYRMVGIYTAGIVGTYTAMSFFPLGAAAIYMIYTDDDTGIKPVFRHAIMLAVSMTGVITSHTLSTVMAVEILVVFCLLEVRKTFTPRIMLSFFTSMIITILMTLFYLVPFLDYYLHVDTLISHNSDDIHHIQNGGVCLYQLFAFFQDPYKEEFDMIPGMLLMLVFVSSVCLLIFKVITDQAIRVLTVLSGIALLISTNAFPWDWITNHSRIGNFFSQIQFAMRYLEFACIILTLLMGILIERIHTKNLLNSSCYNIMLGIAASITFIGVCVFYGQLAEHAYYCNIIDGSEISSGPQIGPEYVRVDSEGEPILYIRKDVESKNANTEVISRRGYTMDIKIHTEDVPGVIMTPYTNYKGYEAYDFEGNSFEIFDDEYCKVSFTVPAYYDGIVEVSFVEPWYWRLSEIISLIVCGIVLLYFIISNKTETGKR